MNKTENGSLYEDIEMIKLDNGIKILYMPNYEYNMSIGFLNFGFNVSFSYKKIGIVHFMEHILCTILQKILKNNISAFTTFEQMYINFEKYIKLDNNIIDKIINVLYLDNKIHIDDKYLSKHDIKNIRHHIHNEMTYRIIEKSSRGDLFLYLLSGYDYIGGSGFDIEYNVKLFNKILSLISTKNTVFITKNKNIYNYLQIRLKNIKKSSINKIIINYKLPKQKYKNEKSTLLLSISKIFYTVTIFIPMNKMSLIGMFIISNFINRNIIIYTFNDKISISIYRYTMNSLLMTLILLKEKENSYNIYIDENDIDIFRQCILYSRYIDTFNILNIILKTKSCDYFKKEIDYTIDLIANSYNKYDSFFLNIPLLSKNYIYNNKTISDFKIFQSEIILDIPKKSINNIYHTFINKPKSVTISDFTNDINVCFFLFSECKYEIKENGIELTNFKNVYIENKNYVLNIEFYFDKLPLYVYYKYILLFVLTNIFSSLYDIIEYYYYVKSIYYNPNYVNLNSFNSNIQFKRKIINIQTEYNFVTCFIKFDKIIDMENNNYIINIISIISNELISKFLIYLISYKEVNKYLFITSLTSNPNKASKIYQKLFSKLKIKDYLLIISNESTIINIDELIKSKSMIYS